MRCDCGAPRPLLCCCRVDKRVREGASARVVTREKEREMPRRRIEPEEIRRIHADDPQCNFHRPDVLIRDLLVAYDEALAEIKRLREDAL